MPPLWFRGERGHTRLRVRWWGGPNSEEGTDTVVLWFFVTNSKEWRDLKGGGESLGDGALQDHQAVRSLALLHCRISLLLQLTANDIER